MHLENETLNSLTNKEESAKQRLISDEKFKLLKYYQHNIFKITEISPSLRKIINELITEDNLQVIQAKLVTALS